MRYIIYTSEAHENLHEIFLYTADKWGIEQAKNYHNKFDDVFGSLALNPNIGHRHDYLLVDYFVYPVGSHLVIYRFTNSELIIIAIVHMVMDVKNRLIKMIKSTK